MKSFQFEFPEENDKLMKFFTCPESIILKAAIVESIHKKGWVGFLRSH
jgi:hypothetical protein